MLLFILKQKLKEERLKHRHINIFFKKRRKVYDLKGWIGKKVRKNGIECHLWKEEIMISYTSKPFRTF